MATWFEIGGYPAIKPVEVGRFTDDSAWVNGRRRKRLTEWNGVFPTWDEAKAYLLAEHRKKVDSARRHLDYENSRLGNIIGLKPPRASDAAGDGGV